MQLKHSWLDETHKLILDHSMKFRKLWSRELTSDENFYDAAYDAGASANWVNDRISQSTFDKQKWFNPQKYILKKYNYDSYDMCTKLSDLREYIIMNGEDISRRKLVINEIDKVYRLLLSLNNKVLADMKTIEIKLSVVKKSFL